MRTYSFFKIGLLCLVILAVDAMAFYWLQSITRIFLSDALATLIHIVFWIFTIGLISAIMLIKYRMDQINPKRKQRLIASFYGLTVSSFIPKIIFVLVISFLYFTNYLISEEESLILVPTVGLLSGFLPFFVILSGIFRSLYRFKIHHIKISSNKLPSSFHGTKLVHISDLHLGSLNFKYDILYKIVQLVNETEPDLICFTGDLVNNFAWELEGWDQPFSQFKAKLGKFAVLGNHDYGDYSEWPTVQDKKNNAEAIQTFIRNAGFELLLNNSYVCKKASDQMAIIGVENWGLPPFKQYGDLEMAIEHVKNEPFKVILSHDPTHWKEDIVNKTDAVLTLSGHTHGMQAGVQYKHLRWSPIKYKYKHWAGLYEEKGQYLYVNRGLGWLGFPGRLGMRPEITLIELVRKDLE